MEWFGWGDGRREREAQEAGRITERSHEIWQAKADADYAESRQRALWEVCSKIMSWGINIDEIEELLKIRIERSIEALKKTQRT